jgi:hypothetical protein
VEIVNKGRAVTTISADIGDIRLYDSDAVELGLGWRWLVGLRSLSASLLGLVRTTPYLKFAWRRSSELWGADVAGEGVRTVPCSP